LLADRANTFKPSKLREAPHFLSDTRFYPPFVIASARPTGTIVPADLVTDLKMFSARRRGG
jgi:hypothetical protein